jgi:hypothetical protein
MRMIGSVPEKRIISQLPLSVTHFMPPSSVRCVRTTFSPRIESTLALSKRCRIWARWSAGKWASSRS